MAIRDWSTIQTWQTFESLVRTIVQFQDPNASLLARPGSDGGQDVRSSDNRRVYQAKYHMDQNPAKAISDAKNEAKRISEYKKPGHDRHSQWVGVTFWTLVTNAHFNHNDFEKWKNEVEPEFRKLGIQADFWECAKIETFLTRYPEIEHRYFGGETAYFLSLTEARAKMASDEPFLDRDSLGPFRGRTEEIREIKEFVNTDQLYLLVHGQGGVGKTRTLLEAASQIEEGGPWQILWANLATMEKSGAWFKGMIPEKPTLLIVDDPQKEDILKVLIEQLGGHLARTAKWKVAMTVPTPRDPVIGFLRSARIKSKVRELAVFPLPKEDATSMLEGLISSSTNRTFGSAKPHEVAEAIAELLSGSLHPIWLTLAIHLLERGMALKNMPTSTMPLAADYVSEILKSRDDSESTILGLLRWTALLGPVNREENGITNHIAGKVGLETGNRVLLSIKHLIDRKALVARGARDRLVEVKPDVIRDHILTSWLAQDVGVGENPWVASTDAENISKEVLESLRNGDQHLIALLIISSLARVERLLRHAGKDVTILDELVEQYLAIIPTLEAPGRIKAAEVFLEIARFRPDAAVKFSKVARRSPCNDVTVEMMLGSKTLGFSDVISELPWVVFNGAFGAETTDQREIILMELCELAETEQRLERRPSRRLQNDGRRASDLIRRIIGGDPSFVRDFDDVVEPVSKALVQHVLSDVTNSEGREALLSLVAPVLSIERTRRWFDGYSFVLEQSIVLSNTKAAANRDNLLNLIKEWLVDSEVPEEFQIQLWRLFSESHIVLNSHRGRHRQVPEIEAIIRNHVLENLGWSLEVLKGKNTEFRFVEAASTMWRNFMTHEDDPEILSALRALDREVYQKNPIAAEFGDLLSFSSVRERRQLMLQKAEELSSRTADGIENFVDAASQFLGGECNLHQIGDIATELGQIVPMSDSVRSFVHRSLNRRKVSGRTEFAASVVRSSVFAKREEQVGDVPEFLDCLLKQCGSDAQRVCLLTQVYGGLIRSGILEKVSDREFSYIRGKGELFVKEGADAKFVSCVAWGFRHNWEELRDILDEVLGKVLETELEVALSVLVDAIYIGIRESKPDDIPSGLREWLLGRLVELPDIDSLRGYEFHGIEAILRETGQPSVSWLVGALRKRHEMEINAVNGTVRALGRRTPIAQFVRPLTRNEAADFEGAVRELVALSMCRSRVGFFIYEVVRHVDPNGLLVPALVRDVLQETTDVASRLCVARLGLAYKVGSEQWRQIAAPVLTMVRNENWTEADRNSAYRALSDPGFNTTVAAWGEVPSSVTQEVVSAREALASECDDAFLPFWEWRLKRASSSWEDHHEAAREDRGE